MFSSRFFRSTLSRTSAARFNPFISSYQRYSSRVLDPYSVLGVSKSATDDEIKKAYRKKARQYHPDVNKAPDATKKFQEINEAYEMIGTNQARKSHEYESKFQQGFSQQFYQSKGRSQKSSGQRRAQFTEEDLFEQLFRQHAESMYSNSRQRYQNSHQNAYRNQQWYVYEPNSGGEQAFFQFGTNYGKRTPFDYDASSLQGNFPRSFVLKENLIHSIPNGIKYTIIQSGVTELGTIDYNYETLRYNWINHNGSPIAQGTTTVLQDSFWIRKEKIRIEDDRNKQLGNIQVSYFPMFPIFSRICLFNPGDTPVAECFRFAFMGTRLVWKHSEGQTIGIAFRGVINFLGRYFDVDIATRHDSVNPALYMFSVLHSHRLDIQISPIRAVGRFLSRHFTPKRTQ